MLKKVEETVHIVPYGDRSETIVEPYLTDQWFLDAKKLAGPAIEAVVNGETKFVPKLWENTFFDWMNNIEPWCISRQLWWGHRIPAWPSNNGAIFVAKNELDEYLINSAVLGLHSNFGHWCFLYKSFIIFFAISSANPITILSGYLKSLIASPSLRNSGLDTTSNKDFLTFFAIIFSTTSPVVTGTVDLLTIIL